MLILKRQKDKCRIEKQVIEERNASKNIMQYNKSLINALLKCMKASKRRHIRVIGEIVTDSITKKIKIKIDYFMYLYRD